MADLTKAKFKVFKQDETFETIDVLYNPNALTFTKKPKLADINIPGLDAPLKQFVRGETETLKIELFFDTTEGGTGARATSVTTLTDPFYGLTKIDPTTHAPPICSFIWGAKFPGDRLPEMHQNQRRTEFKGLVTDVRQDFKLFSPSGTPLRAVLSLEMDEYRPLHEQIRQLNLQSSDHTRAHVLERGESLSSVAWQHYRNPAEWRRVADANGITDPRRVAPGRTLVIPPVA